jgi:hypothetical protein
MLVDGHMLILGHGDLMDWNSESGPMVTGSLAGAS